MSLINNALKKAQHQRSEEAMKAPLPGGPGRRPNRRGQTMSAQLLVLIIVGAAMLIAASVVATVFLLGNEKTTATDSVTASAPAVSPTSTESTPQATVASTTPAPMPAPADPEPVITAASPVIDSPITSAQPEPDPVAAASEIPEVIPKPTISLEDQVYEFIDQLKVMGVRSSGTDSKVLMNNHVYRVSEIVNRELGLRLDKVTPDSLTFVDANGESYIKKL